MVQRCRTVLRAAAASCKSRHAGQSSKAVPPFAVALGHHTAAAPRPASRTSTSVRTACPRRFASTSSAPHESSASVQGEENGKGKGKDKQPKVGLTVELDREKVAGRQGATLEDVLRERMPKGGNEFLVARANDGQVYSLQALVPPHVESVTFIAFDSSDSAARDAFWLSSAYLVGAALQEEHGTQLLLSGAPALASAGSGGAGFAYEYLLDARSDAERAQAVPGDAHEAVVELLEGQPSKPTSLSDAALVDLEKRVQSLVAANLPFEISSVPRAEAEELLADNPFKRERIASLGKNEVALLRLGNFVDLAPEGGALVPRTKAIKAFRLTEWSAATWTPSTPTSAYVPATQPLVRLRAVSFPKPAELKAHLSAQAAAAASDHRVVGRAQSLFLTHDMSPGSAFLLPHGMRLARKVERVVRDLYDVYGYDEVQTPLLFRQALWKQSGHWENYRDDMFAVEGFKEREERQAELLARSSSSVGIDSRMEGLNRTGCCAHSHEEPTDAKGAETAGAEFGLKPMNCPGHCLVFSSQERSYRELPIRYAEFSPLHRNESSGSLSGLTRVRRFHQDDAHVFCTSSQVSSEISTMLSMLSSAYTTFGFRSFELVLSTRPPSFIGDVADWDRAETDLRAALDASGRPWSLNPGDGAFYGPKIDIRLVDAAGRKHQTATIQLDFQLPQRFDLKYTSPEGERRPVMIHRAILGSVERFLAILIEQCAGWWPFWLSPRQAIVLPVGPSEAVRAHAQRVRNHLALGAPFEDLSARDPTAPPPARPSQVFHVDVDPRTETLGRMVRRAQLARYNFVLIVGEKEAAEGTVAVRARDDSAAPKLEMAPPEGFVEGKEGRESTPELKKDMGMWKLEDLRKLFCTLDSNHL